MSHTLQKCTRDDGIIFILFYFIIFFYDHARSYEHSARPVLWRRPSEAPRELLAKVSNNLKLLLADDADIPCVVCQRQCAAVFKQKFDGELWHKWFQQEKDQLELFWLKSSLKARARARMTTIAWTSILDHDDTDTVDDLI